MRELTERLEGKGVVNGIGDFARQIRQWGNQMAMTPKLVGPGALFIDERDARVDVGDVSEPGFPDKRRELDLEPEHLPWENGCDLVSARTAQSEIWRGELGEVSWVREKVPRFSSRNAEFLSLMEGVNAHKKTTNGETMWFGFRG